MRMKAKGKIQGKIQSIFPFIPKNLQGKEKKEENETEQEIGQ